jgi:hypothetical protein
MNINTCERSNLRKIVECGGGGFSKKRRKTSVPDTFWHESVPEPGTYVSGDPCTRFVTYLDLAQSLKI